MARIVVRATSVSTARPTTANSIREQKQYRESRQPATISVHCKFCGLEVSAGFSTAGMARSSLTGDQLEHQYGEMLRSAPWCDCISAAILHGALTSRDPPVDVSLKAMRVWWGKYNIPAGAETASSALELEERYGDGIRHFALEYPTAFKLGRALREREPPLCITDKVATVWLQKYARRGDVRIILNAGHLET